MTRQPKISVIIPAYNAAEFVSEAIQSVLDQTYPNVECVVVNDGSTDATESILRQFGDSIALISMENQGVSAARNRGVAAASGEWIGFLDADDVWHHDNLSSQLKHVGRLCNDVDVHSTNLAIERTHLNADDYFDLIRLPPELRDRSLSCPTTALLDYHFAWLQSSLVRKSLLERFENPFDPGLSLYEDFDLFLRLSLEARWATCSEVLVQIKRRGDGTNNLSAQRLNDELKSSQTMLRILMRYGDDVSQSNEAKHAFARALQKQYLIVGNLCRRHSNKAVARKMYWRGFLAKPSIKAIAKLALP
ncbi:MAG: glycosyltransferase [Pseudomonadota bacterium]